MKKCIALSLALLLSLSACGRETPAETRPVPGTEAAIQETALPAAEATVPAPTETLPPETAPQPERFLLTFVGDCTLGASPNCYYADVGFIKTVGDDYGYPFRNVIGYFQNDELTLVNLEGPLTDTGGPVQKKHTFKGPADYVRILTENSIEAVSIANNHTLDYGPKGYASTVSVLEEAGIPYAERDSGRLVTTSNGLRVGIYGMVYYKLDAEDMKAGVAALREQGADIVIVAPHWGFEGTYKPTAEQEQIGRAAIDAGADIVWGSHPHVLQPVEVYNGGVIFYSLGNFSFGGNTRPDDFDTAIIQQEVLRHSDGTVTLGEVTCIPACISSDARINNYQPTPYAPDTEDYRRAMSKLVGTFQQ